VPIEWRDGIPRAASKNIRWRRDCDAANRVA
jgi:hypothetical protein